MSNLDSNAPSSMIRAQTAFSSILSMESMFIRWTMLLCHGSGPPILAIDVIDAYVKEFFSSTWFGNAISGN